MSIHDEEADLTTLIHKICRYLLQMVSAKGSQAAELRRQVGLIRVNGLEYLADKTFGTKLWECFVTARTLPITTDLVAFVREQVALERPTTMICTLVVETTIIYCLTTECLFITSMTFKSRDDVANMMARMTDAFNGARDQAADRMDSATYETLTALAGSIINHLSSTALTLPRIVQFDYQASRPALTVSNLIYQDASRWSELVDENKVVHPAFMPRSLIGLSA